MTSRKKPLVLLILDGWGHREETSNNAIAQANTPVMDQLWRDYPHTLISGSGLDVGFAVSPMVFGLFMDRGWYALTLAGAALVLLVSVYAAVGVGSRTSL